MVDRNGQRIAKRVSFFVLCRIDLNKFTSPKKKKKSYTIVLSVGCATLDKICMHDGPAINSIPKKGFKSSRRKKKWTDDEKRRLFLFCFSRRCWAKIMECNTGLLIKSLLPPSYLKNGVRKERPTRSFER